MKRRSFLWDLVKAFVGTLLIILIINHWIIKPVRVVGVSMFPTLENGQMGFSNILAHNLGTIERFEIVIISTHQDDQEVFIVKRAIGLPNETIEVKDDVLYIDGRETDQPFFDNTWYKSIIESSNTPFTYDFGPITLGEDEYFVMGDNRRFSQDSRFYGSFSREDIVAKDIYILYPFSDMQIIQQ